jgi:lipopolysaccharide transport system permease protein
MFATPSIYLNSRPAATETSLLLALNPAHGLISAFRATAFGENLDWPMFGVSSVVGFLLLFLGITYFRRVERSFADVI